MTTPHHRDRHRGTFAQGQATEPHHPEDAPGGDYAAGQDAASHTDEGTFATGQVHDHAQSQPGRRGRFAGG